MSQYMILRRDTQEMFSCGEDQTLLSAMEQQSKQSIAVGCRGGGCGVCKIMIVSGIKHSKKMSRKRVTEEEENLGYTLACRTYPDSDIEFEYLGVSGL